MPHASRLLPFALCPSPSALRPLPFAETKKGTLPDPLETIYLTSLFQAVNMFLYRGLEVRGLVCVNDVLLGQLVEH